MLRYIAATVSLLLILVLAGAGATLYLFWTYGQSLPDYQQLANYDPPVMTRVHAASGELMAEYAKERRLFVPVEAMPKTLINAFLSAEDKNFYTHPGVDIMGVLRAVFVNIRNLGSERRMVGASTITQQVAKNFLLSSEVSFTRKIKEAILAFRIERAFSKDRILELYLNEIYLGAGSYGVAAAALNYFDKSLDELEIWEMAYLAALPKAPNNYNPVRRHAQAVARRNWVIDRMLEDGYVSPEEAVFAKAQPLSTKTRLAPEFVSAEWFTEEVRRELYDRYGEKALYQGGLSVRATIEPRLQEIAQRSLRNGLIAYDRRHGWRGPLGRLDTEGNWLERLKAFEMPAGILPSWRIAVVLQAEPKEAAIGLVDGQTGRVPFGEMKWARPWLKGQKLGPSVHEAGDVLAVGDIVAVEPISDDKTESATEKPAKFTLRQIPDVNGGVVVMDPHTGRVLALVGGWSAERSQFNRATQAARQPGSAFKPFVYAAALEKGFTPASLVLDGPFVIDQGPGLGLWKPGNYARKYYGPSTLRLGIEKSRNLMTVRLAQYIGMDAVAETARRFGIADNLPRQLSMALGAGETTLLRLTSAYAMFVNGGKWIEPSLIDRIQDRRGKTIYRHDNRVCEDCQALSWQGQPEPVVKDTRPQVIDAATAYQVVSMLQGVVERGTGRRIRSVGKPLAGKTGTTNDSYDSWFVGFSPDLAVGVYAGFDKPRTLGNRETGSSVAAPIFRQIMAEALDGVPGIPFRIPPGVRMVRVDGRTGLPAEPGAPNTILEAFKPGTEPSGERRVLDGSAGVSGISESGNTPRAGTGGLY